MRNKDHKKLSNSPTSTSNKNLDKLQGLLRDMFQFDAVDLDFGIYRIMNRKRAVIEKFIQKDLVDAVSDELQRGALHEQSQALKELEKVTIEVREALGDDALDDDGNLADTYHTSRLGKKYLSARAEAVGSKTGPGLEVLIFNHLFSFFSRYYDAGDFMSKRRYSKKERYAIPYNGEEVHLHWANSDQYYIKTVERFQNYSFITRGVTVHFKLVSASVEQDNIKGENRLFLPRSKETGWDETTAHLTIPFEYRPLTEQEEISYGRRNQQHNIIARALENLPKQLKQADKALMALTAERHKNADGESVSFLEHHLRQYTRRNTSDFFIHKHLKSFLDNELDFYLKNEVLSLDEMVAAGEERAEGWFQVMYVIKALGGRIIDFLEQIEGFQRMLWEKQKLVTETQYCITLGNVDEKFYAEIAACDPQWTEWKNLFHIDKEQTNLFTSGKGKKERRIAFLRQHSTLVLDTRHFTASFVDQILASFENLDGICDGVLVHGENFQVLNLLSKKHHSSVKVAYLDPPYNTSEETFVYKNSYRHSSWLAMMHSRVALLMDVLSDDGILMVAIDDAEVYRLKLALDGLLGDDNYLGTIVVQSNPRGRGIHSYYATSHDYYLVYAKEAAKAAIVDQPLTGEQAREYRHSDEKSQYRLLPFRRSGGLSTPDERPNSEFTLYYSKRLGRIFAVGGERTKSYPAKYEPSVVLCAHEQEFSVSGLSAKEFQKVVPKDTVEILPVDSNGARRVWRWSDRRKILQAAFDGDFVVRDGDSRTVLLKDRIKEGRKPKTVWVDSKYDASSHGTNLLQDILGERRLFGYPKSLYSTHDALHSVMGNLEDTWAVDVFAGSGTTGHAIVKLNQNDGGRRKFILAEMGEYFETVLLPRIKKIVFAPEWKDGKPVRVATKEEAGRSPRIIKYMRLESYEDSLSNIEFEDTSAQRAMDFDDYVLKYMLKWETRRSETLLNVEKLARPFHYTMNIMDGEETTKRSVDIPETFNYLLGLQVAVRRVEHDGDRRYLVYRGRIDHREIAVIWRDTEGWEKDDLQRDKKFVAERKLADGADEIFVNGDSLIPSARALEPLFKGRMFSSVEG